MPISRPGTNQQGAGDSMGQVSASKSWNLRYLISTKCRAESRWGCHAPFSADFVDTSGVLTDGNVGLPVCWGIMPRQHLSAAPVLSAARRFEGQARVPNRGGDEHGKRWENMLDDWAVVDVVFEQM